MRLATIFSIALLLLASSAAEFAFAGGYVPFPERAFHSRTYQAYAARAYQSNALNQGRVLNYYPEAPVVANRSYRTYSYQPGTYQPGVRAYGRAKTQRYGVWSGSPWNSGPKTLAY